MSIFNDFVAEQKTITDSTQIERDEFLTYKDSMIKKMAKLQYENILLCNDVAKLNEMLKMFEVGYNMLDEKIHKTNLLIRKLYKKIK